MICRNGYLKVIDFGFAKRVPYFKKSPPAVSAVAVDDGERERKMDEDKEKEKEKEKEKLGQEGDGGETGDRAESSTYGRRADSGRSGRTDSGRSSGSLGSGWVSSVADALTASLVTKTFTLCGTPEYVAPEVILSSGHDQMTDIWSFGVMLYEMIMGRTPFRPADRDNVTDLFTNVVMAAKNGIELSAKVDERSGRSPLARKLIMQLLSGNPSDRLRTRAMLDGQSPPATGDLLQHPYFLSNLDVEAVRNQTLTPVWIPSIDLPDASSRPAKTKSVEPFDGDQAIFANF